MNTKLILLECRNHMHITIIITFGLHVMFFTCASAWPRAQRLSTWNVSNRVRYQRNLTTADAGKVLRLWESMLEAKMTRIWMFPVINCFDNSGMICRSCFLGFDLLI